MCFSPEADLVAGLVISAVGVDVLVRSRRASRASPYRFLAALPLLLGLHQLVEALVWWGTTGSAAAGTTSLATWTYLLVAFVVLPVYVPLATWAIEPPGRRRDAMALLSVVGAAVAVTLLAAMLVGPVQVHAAGHHLAYSTSLRAGTLVVALYVLATCGAFLLSGEPVIAAFGAVNLVAVSTLAVLDANGFASLWCAWAAVTSAAFAWYARRGSAPRAQHHLQHD